MDDNRAQVFSFIAEQPSMPDDGVGVVAILRRICRALAGAVSAAGVGMSVVALDGTRGVTAAADPASQNLEDLQYLLGEGPSTEAFATGRPVLVPDLTGEAAHRWPIYSPMLRHAGIQAVFTFPLQVGAARLGVLDIFRAWPGELSPVETQCALTFAEVGMLTLLDGQEAVGPGVSAPGLDGAVEHRAQLFQAQGMVMVQLGVDLTEALVRIRAHAYAEDRTLDEVAKDIIARRLRFTPERPGAL